MIWIQAEKFGGGKDIEKERESRSRQKEEKRREGKYMAFFFCKYFSNSLFADCPTGTTLDYNGYLFGPWAGHTKSSWMCMHNTPQVIPNTAGDDNGLLVYAAQIMVKINNKFVFAQKLVLVAVYCSCMLEPGHNHTPQVVPNTAGDDAGFRSSNCSKKTSSLWLLVATIFVCQSRGTPRATGCAYIDFKHGWR